MYSWVVSRPKLLPGIRAHTSATAVFCCSREWSHPRWYARIYLFIMWLIFWKHINKIFLIGHILMWYIKQLWSKFYALFTWVVEVAPDWGFYHWHILYLSILLCGKEQPEQAAALGGLASRHLLKERPEKSAPQALCQSTKQIMWFKLWFIPCLELSPKLV